MSSDLRRASGLWLKDGKKGKFMSGQTDAAIPAGSKLLIFKNDKKTSENQPDYQLFIADGSADRPAHSRPRQNGHVQTVDRRPAPVSTVSAPPPPTEDSIPF